MRARGDDTGVHDPAAEGAVADVQEQTQAALSRSGVLVAAKVITWLLAFVMTIVMPRYLGSTGYGRLYLAQSITGIMAILVEFGLNSLATREVARRPADAVGYLRSGAILKAALWVLASLGVAVFVAVAGYPAETTTAVALLALSVLFAVGSSLIVSVLQAMDRMRWIAVSTVAEKVVYVGLGVTALLLGYGVVTVAFVTLLGAIAGFVLNLWWLRRLGLTIDLRSGTTAPGVRELLRRALPFFSVLFFGAIYFRLDVVILSLMRPDAAVGFYGASYRLFQTTYILADAFVFSLFPLFCRLASTSEDGLPVAAQKSIDTLLLLGIPITAGMAVLAEDIVLLLYGSAYAESIVLLRVLSLAIALMYANGIFVQLLIATERQRRLALTAGIAAGLNVLANFALIPMLGALGAAIATVATELIVIALNFRFLPRSLTERLRFGTVGKYVVAALVMACALLLLGGRSLLLLVPAGVVVYFVALAAFRALPTDEWATLKAMLASRRRR